MEGKRLEMIDYCFSKDAQKSCLPPEIDRLEESPGKGENVKTKTCKSYNNNNSRQKDSSSSSGKKDENSLY